MLCALSIKPLEGSRLRLRRTRSIGNSIDLELEGIANKGVARKAWLLMLVNALLPAFNPVMVRRGCSSFKRRYARTHTRGSVRRASGFVLTGNPDVIDGVDLT